MNYIERYWRDAKPEDAIKEPWMVARFRNDDDENWLIDTLVGIDRAEKRTWVSRSWCTMHCQVYDAPDPGEGWRLVDIDNEEPQVGDEWLYGDGAWKERSCGGVSSFSGHDIYRRRIAPTVTYVPFTWDDREQLRGRWIRRETSEVMIYAFTNHDKFFINGIDPDVLRLYWTFIDTSEPVGKKVTQ